MSAPITQTLTERTALVKAKIEDLKKTHPEYTEWKLRAEAIKELKEAKTINF